MALQYAVDRGVVLEINCKQTFVEINAKITIIIIKKNVIEFSISFNNICRSAGNHVVGT